MKHFAEALLQSVFTTRNQWSPFHGLFGTSWKDQYIALIWLIILQSMHLNKKAIYR